MLDCDATDRQFTQALVIVGDMFGIAVCRSRSAHIDGGNGFPIRLFAHALASNTVTHVLFNVWHQCLLCCEQSEGDLILSESRFFASENHSSNPHVHRCFLALSGLTWLLALPQWHLSNRCKKYASWWSSKTISWVTQTGCPAAPHMNKIRGICIGGLPMRQWCSFSVMRLRDTSHHGQSLNYPEPADQNALGGFRQCFFVATMSAFSVCP